MKAKPGTILYYEVGNVERACMVGVNYRRKMRGKPSYRWTTGYSTSPGGYVQPWVTRTEAREAASSEGKKAVFIMKGASYYG